MEEDEFKDTEIGRIPKDWNVEKLIKHVDLIRGKEVGSNNYNNDNKGKRFIRIVDLSGSRDDILYTTSNNVIECNKDDILISFDGSPGIVATNFFGAISSGIRKIYFKDNSLNKKYTYYFLQTIYIQNIIKKFSTGVTIKHASKAIPNLIIIIPPLEEQKRIAYVLSKIENAIKIQDKIINSLQELKKSMMHKLFTEGIGHTEFKDTEIGRIPKDWEIKNLEEIMHIYDSKRVPIDENKRALIKGPFPYCGANGIIDYIDVFIFDGEYILLAEDGGNWGKFERSSYIMSGKFWVNNHAHILKISDKTHGCNYFYMYYFNYVDLSKYISGTTRGKLTQGTVRLIKLPFPPLEEQKRIADILSTIDNKILIEEDRKKYFEALFKTMLNKLMTGQIRVKNLEMRE